MSGSATGIGVERAAGSTWDSGAVASYVLSDPTTGEREALEEAAKRAAEAVHTLLRDGLEAAQQRYNG